MRKNNNDKITIEDNWFYYLIPLFSSAFIVSLIEGGTHYSSQWMVTFTEAQNRAFAAAVLLFVLTMIYTFFIRIPKLYDKSDKIIPGIKLLIKSLFFYLWVFTIPVLLFLRFYNIQYWHIYYFLYLLICFYFQREFNRNYIFLLNS
jgi:hypothetical protein